MLLTCSADAGSSSVRWPCSWRPLVSARSPTTGRLLTATRFIEDTAAALTAPAALSLIPAGFPKAATGRWRSSPPRGRRAPRWSWRSAARRPRPDGGGCSSSPFPPPRSRRPPPRGSSRATTRPAGNEGRPMSSARPVCLWDARTRLRAGGRPPGRAGAGGCDRLVRRRRGAVPAHRVHSGYPAVVLPTVLPGRLGFALATGRPTSRPPPESTLASSAWPADWSPAHSSSAAPSYSPLPPW